MFVSLTAVQARDLTAVVVDVTGSMYDHDFPAIQEQVCGRISTLSPGTVLFVIPFAEDALDVFRVDLAMDSFDGRVAQGQRYVRGLRAGGSRHGFEYGDHTNIDEGVDAAVLALAGEQAEGKKQILLISDGISQPDRYHKPVKLDDLAEKTRRLGVDLVMFDVSGTPVPDIEPELHDGFKIYRFPTPNLQVITPDSPGHWQLVWPVLDSIRGADAEAGRKTPLRWPYALVALVALALVTWLLASRKARPKAAVAVKKLLCVSVNKGQEQQYDLPQVVTVGGDPADTLKIASAKPKELTLNVDEQGGCRFRLRTDDRDEAGVVYGSREFRLACGAPVAVRVESRGGRLVERFRYFRR
jgi:hypothetical protein